MSERKIAILKVVMTLFSCRPFLLECPHKEVREMFGQLLKEMITSFLAHGGVCVSKPSASAVLDFRKLKENIVEQDGLVVQVPACGVKDPRFEPRKKTS